MKAAWEVKDMAWNAGVLSRMKNMKPAYRHICHWRCDGGIQLAHAATAQGRNAVAHMAGEDMVIRTDIIPSCVYTNPEIGCVGISAERQGPGKEAVTKKYIMSPTAKSLLSSRRGDL